MLSNRVKEYIANNSFCSEYLFSDWETFLDILYEEGGRVSSILWWDHCKISEQNASVGMGGYIDSENHDYMYAETQLWKDGLDLMSLDEIKDYIKREMKKGIRYGDNYSSHELVPSFYLNDEL